MAESPTELNQGVNSLALAIIIVIFVAALFSAFLSIFYSGFINMLAGPTYVPGGAIYDVLYVVLKIAADAIYLTGGGVIVFGAMLVTIRFFQIKLKDSFQPSSSTRSLSGYLTLGLNFFIGSGIISSVATRNIPEFEFLILAIFSRGLFSMILYLERRWHGTAETD